MTQRYRIGPHNPPDAPGDAGALSRDVDPKRLPITLVNRYLDIKSSGRL